MEKILSALQTAVTSAMDQGISDGEAVDVMIHAVEDILFDAGIILIHKQTEARDLQQDLEKWVVMFGKGPLPPSIVVRDVRQTPPRDIEVEAHEDNYSCEYLDSLPDENGEGDEDNKMYTYDHLREMCIDIVGQKIGVQ